MAAAVRYRDQHTEARERERFRVLAHIRTCTDDGGEHGVLCSCLADDLGLLRLEAAELIEDLVLCGLVDDALAGPRVRITARGREYLDRLAGRRHSVRGVLVRSSATEPASRPFWRRVLGVSTAV
jgi:hypothetical protein